MLLHIMFYNIKLSFMNKVVLLKAAVLWLHGEIGLLVNIHFLPNKLL